MRRAALLVCLALAGCRGALGIQDLSAGCDAGSCADAAPEHCGVGERRCNGDTPQFCDVVDHWRSQARCSFICSGAGVCGGQCSPGSHQCLDSSTTQTCSPIGTWGADFTCPNGCNAAVGMCTGCEPTAVSCAGRCGVVTNNCNMPTDCGDPCVTPNTCGGGLPGTPNVCGH